MRLKKIGWASAAAIALSSLAYGVSCVDNGNQDDPCPKYCADLAKTCTGNDGQFPSTDNNATCIRMCGAINALDAGNNTIACRALNTSSATDEVDPNAKHQDCVGAGIATNCTSDQCTAFCAADLAMCTGTNAVFTDMNECTTTCAAWGKSFDGALIGSVGDTLQCRTYHLELSQTGVAADLITHCAHTGKVSARCNNSGTDAGTDAGTDSDADASGE